MKKSHIANLCSLAGAYLCGDDIRPIEFFQLLVDGLDETSDFPSLIAEYPALRQVPIVIDEMFDTLDDETKKWLYGQGNAVSLRKIRLALQQAISLQDYGLAIPERVSLISKPKRQSSFVFLKYAAVFIVFAIGGLAGFGGYVTKPLTDICAAGNVLSLRWNLLTGASVETKDSNGCSLLQVAVKNGQRDCVRLLLSNGATPNVKDREGMTPLCHLFSLDRSIALDIGGLLLSAGANPSIGNLEGSTPFTYAAEHGYIGLVSLFIEQNCDIGGKDVHGATALHSAALGGQAEIVELLLKKGLYFDVLSSHGQTPLFSAVARRNNVKVIELLLKAGADVNAVNRWATPLSKAALAGHINNVKILLGAGAEVSSPESRVIHPLTNAVQSNNIELVKLLVDKVGDIDKLKKECEGIVADAIYARNPKLLEYVCDCGFSLDERVGKRQMTALEYATWVAYVDGVRILLARGAKPNVCDKNGTSPLHIACGAMNRLPSRAIVEDETWLTGKYKEKRAQSYMDSQTRVELIDILIENKADLLLAHSSGKSPLHFAADLGSPQVVQHLIKLGASTSAKDNKGRTPYDIAVARKYTKVAELLQ